MVVARLALLPHLPRLYLVANGAGEDKCGLYGGGTWGTFRSD